MKINLKKALEDVRVVESDRRYWFVRTYSGQLYNDFINNHYVGLGFNQVPYKYISDGKKTDLPTFELLQKYLENNVELNKGEATKWANQLLNFEHEIKIGDIVIVPSKGSEAYSFGLVESQTIIIKDPGTFYFEEKYEPYPEKRKKIKWLKEIKKDDLLGDLKALSSSHQALTTADKYAETIEGHLSSVYIKDDTMFLTISINQDEDINAFDLNRLLDNLIYFYNEFCIENGIELNEELFIKIKLQSKGKLVLQGIAWAALFSVAVLVGISDNHEVEMAVGSVKFKGKSTGPLASISNYQDRKAERDFRKTEEEFKREERELRLVLLRDSIEKLKVKPIKNQISAEQDSVSTESTIKN